MEKYKKLFQNKKITVMGLGLLGRGVGDALFLVECGADLTITDLKPSTALKPSLEKLRKYKNIKYTLGEHKLEDFRDKDFILKAAGVPLDSIYIKEAEKNGIPIEMSAALLAKLACLPVVGVTGTRGKSTVVHIVNHLLVSVGYKVVLGGNVRGVSNLQLLKKVSKSDIIVLELDSWQLQGFGTSLVSPNIAVFTTFYDDHMGYYKGDLKQYFSDKAEIFRHQTEDDIFIIGSQVLPYIKKFIGKIKNLPAQAGNMIIPKETLPKGWKFKLPGLHNEYNAMLAVEVARTLGIPDTKIKKALSTFVPVSGRLEFLREVKGIKVYNDNNSTTPEATIAALRAVGDANKRKVVLIIGGDNKFLDMSGLIKEIPKFCSKVVLFKERGTDLIREKVFALKKKGIEVYEEEGLKDTVARAYSVAKKGETILYSPAFSSFGKYFSNEYDRGDKFVKLIKKLK